MRVANAISRYFAVYRPEYYAKIVGFDDYREFDSIPGNYGMDLYVVELKTCDVSDAGFSIAKRLCDGKANCALTFVVPSEAMAAQITREMFRPSYVFLKQAETDEINRFLNSFLLRSGELSFVEFTFQYKKWLVNAENINYIQTCGDKTLIVCTNATLETTERLADLERRLPTSFFRVDKGCLINTKRLISADFTEHKAMFPGGDYVYMSRRGSKKLFDSLNGKNDGGEDIAE
jgi:DNA-binding LytR/AlgR family response regulator